MLPKKRTRSLEGKDVDNRIWIRECKRPREREGGRETGLLRKHGKIEEKERNQGHDKRKKGSVDGFAHGSTRGSAMSRLVGDSFE